MPRFEVTVATTGYETYIVDEPDGEAAMERVRRVFRGEAVAPESFDAGSGDDSTIIDCKRRDA